MKKVLIVHDSGPFVNRLELLLADREVSVLTALSARDAVSLQKAEQADLIIAGTSIHGESGFELSRELKQHARHNLYVVLTGSEKRLDNIENFGASLYLWEKLAPEAFIEQATQFIFAPPRSDLKVMVRVKLTASPQLDLFFCNSVDISASGLLLETGQDMNKGDILTCSFFVPGSAQVQVECEVKRKSAMSASQFQYGIKFLNLSPEAKSAIETFVESRNGKG